MKLFQQKSVIEKYDDVKSFVEAYNIGADDFILATKRIYETCLAPLNLKAHVEYKSKYGSGEPTDVMIDALLEDFRRGRYKRIIAIGGGAVIDMAKILVLDGEAESRELLSERSTASQSAHTSCSADNLWRRIGSVQCLHYRDYFDPQQIRTRRRRDLCR